MSSNIVFKFCSRHYFTFHSGDSTQSDSVFRAGIKGNDKLQAVRAEISAIKKLGLAKEVHEQKLAEGQEIAEMVTLAKIKMGELLNSLPKATANNNLNGRAGKQIEAPVDLVLEKENPDVEVETPEVKPKSEVIKEIGFTQKQAEQLQQMAKNPEIVHAAMAEARENGDIVSQSSVMKAIQESKKPYILSNSGNNERYTPKEYIDAARLVMKTINRLQKGGSMGLLFVQHSGNI